MNKAVKKLKFLNWELNNLGISVNPDYTGKDLTDVKPHSLHLKGKKMKFFNF